jgi:hypothetical protein
MTLSERNVFFRAGIVFCAVSALLILSASFLVIPFYSIMEESSRRPADFFQVFLSNFMNVNYIAVHASVTLVVLFSIAGIILIFKFFEQTAVTEILFIAFFTISFSFETIRLILPLKLMYDFPSFYLLAATRILHFSRFFGIFSLFAASLYASGLDIQKMGYIIITIFIASLLITFGVPIDTEIWDTSLNLISGFPAKFRLIETIVFLSTVIGFFVAVNVRGSKEYIYIGFGIMLAMIGRHLLLRADNWACPVPGILLLSFGVWYACSKLHKIHLWL